MPTNVLGMMTTQTETQSSTIDVMITVRLEILVYFVLALRTIVIVIIIFILILILITTFLTIASLKTFLQINGSRGFFHGSFHGLQKWFFVLLIHQWQFLGGR